MKKYRWIVTTESVPPVQDDGAEPLDGLKLERHVVEYAFYRLRGRLTVTIDGEDFRLPAGFLGLGAARREIFRLGDEQAVLVVEKNGRAQLIFRGGTVEPETMEYSLV